MGWASFRLSQEDRKKLDAMAEKKGMTVSELFRDMIRNGYEQQVVSTATQNLDKLSNDVAKLQTDLSRTLHIVTLLGEAFPYTAKRMKE